MWPDRIVVASPALDDDLGLTQGIEDLAVEQLITQPRIEGFDIAVLPVTARLDIGRLGTDCGNPFLNRTRHELGSIVGTHVPGTPRVGSDGSSRRAFRLAARTPLRGCCRDVGSGRLPSWCAPRGRPLCVLPRLPAVRRPPFGEEL